MGPSGNQVPGCIVPGAVRNLSNFDPGMSMKDQKAVINTEMTSFREAGKKLAGNGLVWGGAGDLRVGFGESALCTRFSRRESTQCAFC